FAEAPLTAEAREDLVRLHTASIDYMPDLNPVQKAAALKRMSYQDFLSHHAKVGAQAIAFFNGDAYRNNKRVDPCPAYEAARGGAVGFAGMAIDGEPLFDSKFEAHFPDGNATIARLLVNRLVPSALPGDLDMNSVISAP